MSKTIEAFLSVISVIVDNPVSILIVLGFLAILIGWAFGTIWIIALGIFMLIAGIIGYVLSLSR